MIRLVIQNQSHRPLADLRRKLVRRSDRHASILLGSWSLRKTRRGSDPHLTGTRQAVENRVETLARGHETLIVAIDECQHLRPAKREESMSDALKRAVQRGVFSIVVIGQEQELKAMLEDRQIQNRCLPAIRLAPHSITSRKDILHFCGFIASLDRDMVKFGIFQEPAGFVENELWKPLMIASSGYVGVASKLIALAIAEYVGDDDRRLGRAALERAFDGYVGLAARVGGNPFRT